MTKHDRYSSFCGKVADNKDNLGLSAFEYNFADDNRFTFNFSPRQIRVVEGLISKYGKRLGWRD